ncbi:hypothetical protein N018_12515 [Pseudomonas syringae CC1557]|uniref:Uncharacterized protein n=1 Tax=Pseudomonas syringae CC1557 TaxID=1357279 RepID=W0N282_PSESX|nr:hypothetical protein N018_12515 [Pseudomonas syringae CC1557]
MTFALGEALQFDWSEEGLLIAGLYQNRQRHASKRIPVDRFVECMPAP